MFKKLVCVFFVGIAQTYAANHAPTPSHDSCVILGEEENPRCYFQAAYADLFQFSSKMVMSPGSAEKDLVKKRVVLFVVDEEPIILEGILKKIEQKSWTDYGGDSNPYAIYHIQLSDGTMVSAASDKIQEFRVAIPQVSLEEFKSRYKDYKSFNPCSDQSNYSANLPIVLENKTAAFLVKTSLSCNTVIEGIIVSKQKLKYYSFDEYIYYTLYTVKTADGNTVEISSEQILGSRIKPFLLTIKVLK